MDGINFGNLVINQKGNFQKFLEKLKKKRDARLVQIIFDKTDEELLDMFSGKVEEGALLMTPKAPLAPPMLLNYSGQIAEPEGRYEKQQRFMISSEVYFLERPDASEEYNFQKGVPIRVRYTGDLRFIKTILKDQRLIKSKIVESTPIALEDTNAGIVKYYPEKSYSGDRIYSGLREILKNYL